MVTFLQTFIYPDPRTQKRIRIAKESGSVSVICIRRKGSDFFAGKSDDIRCDCLEIIMPPVKHLLKRLVASIHFLRFAIAKLREINPDIIHCFGMDCLFIACLFRFFNKKNAKIIYEVADLRECFLSNRKSLQTLIFPLFEKSLLKHISLLIITSEKFYECYYFKYLPKEKVLFIPNAPDLSFFSNYQKQKHSCFTVGFIGSIRYLRQMKLLIDASKECPNIKIIFAGGFSAPAIEQEINQYSAGKGNIENLGKYNYSTDICKLYKMLDCVYSVYDADNLNVRIALPNKLYEAAFCELPIIVAKNTYLSEIVLKYGTGIAVSHTDKTELVSALKRLSEDTAYYNSIVENCHKNKDMISSSSSLNEYGRRIALLLDQPSPNKDSN